MGGPKKFSVDCKRLYIGSIKVEQVGVLHIEIVPHNEPETRFPVIITIIEDEGGETHAFSMCPEQVAQYGIMLTKALRHWAENDSVGEEQ